MRTAGRFSSAFLVGLFLGGGLLGRAAGGPPKEQTGLKVGEMAPQFTLIDQAGKERTLGEFLKRGKVALVFYRSAGW